MTRVIALINLSASAQPIFKKRRESLDHRKGGGHEKNIRSGSVNGGDSISPCLRKKSFAHNPRARDSGAGGAYRNRHPHTHDYGCLLYTPAAADDLLCVALGGRRIIKKK